jgi:hypothetical protein
VDPPGAVLPGPVRGELLPDDVLDIPSTQAFVNMLRFVITRNKETGITTFEHDLLEVIPPRANGLSYFALADTDNDPNTGGQLADLAVLGVPPTTFQGVELVTRVQVLIQGDPEFGLQVVVPTVWKFQAGAFVPISNPSIQAQHEIAEAADNPRLASSNISIAFSEAVLGSVAEPFRMQALTQNPTTEDVDSLQDILPAGGQRVSLIPSVFPPTCEVSPVQAQPGFEVKVNARGLIPNDQALVSLGDESVAVGPIDSMGEAEIRFAIPQPARAGSRLVTVGVEDTALTADCGVMVLPFVGGEDPTSSNGESGTDRCINGEVVAGCESP